MRLNIGCGSVVVPGWVNADCDGRAEVFADMRTVLPWDPETFECAVANHSLQMLGYLELVPALRELRRVIEPGGALRILVPDLLGAVEAYRQADESWFPSIVGDERTLAGRFCTYVTWYSTARTVFTREWLIELCERAGFMLAKVATAGDSPFHQHGICELDSRHDESIIVEALR